MLLCYYAHVYIYYSKHGGVYGAIYSKRVYLICASLCVQVYSMSAGLEHNVHVCTVLWALITRHSQQVE